MSTFNPNEHITQLKGKDYLEVKWRLVWFRQEHPDWGIHSEVVQFDAQMALVKATITNADGLVMAQGHKQEEPKHFADFLEKAETGAIGRALGVLGYGTQFAPEFDEGDRIVDSPVAKPAAAPKPAAQPTRAPAAPAAPAAEVSCAQNDCGKPITAVRLEGGQEYSQADWIALTTKHFGAPYCVEHATVRRNAAAKKKEPAVVK